MNDKPTKKPAIRGAVPVDLGDGKTWWRPTKDAWWRPSELSAHFREQGRHVEAIAVDALAAAVAATRPIRDLAALGSKFTPRGRKAPPLHPIDALIDEGLKALGSKASPVEVREYIRRKHQGVSTIEDIDDEAREIQWRRENGKEFVMKFKTFDNRLSKRRKIVQK